MEELISKKDLHDKIVKLELSALEQMKILAKLGNTEEYNKMNAVLMERTAFKFDVVDAPVILQIPDTGIGDLSDGYHTFNQLYYQRMMLFAALVRVYKQFAWKSRRHEDGELCFNGGWFVVGIDTPRGSYTYHYEDKYWDKFDCEELPVGKHWDGHTEEDAETRLMSLNPEPHWIPVTERLPKEDGSYLVSGKWGSGKESVGDCEFSVEDGYFQTAWNFDVLAWMPLPEPFKGATE